MTHILASSFHFKDFFHPLRFWGYQFWSGIGSDFTEITLLAGVYVFYRKHNCPTKGCWRLGRHHVPGTSYVTCRKHHPHPKPTAEDILHDHEASGQ